MRAESIKPDAELAPRFSLWSFLQEQQMLDRAWQTLADTMAKRPGTIFLGVFTLLLPFAMIGVAYHSYLSYGLLTDLPQDDPSVVGAKALQRHFVAGVAGPTTVLIQHPDLNLPDGAAGGVEGERFAEVLSDQLRRRMDELQLVDIRSQNAPLGISEIAREYVDRQRRDRPLIGGRAIQVMARRTYTSQAQGLAGDVMRLDFLFNVDPFDRTSIGHLDDLEAAIREALPLAYTTLLADRAAGPNREVNPHAGEDDLPPSVSPTAEAMARESTIASIGSTASIRDLKHVTDRDQLRIFALVVIAVYLVLIALLRKPAICAWLILTVVFSYLVALGVCFAFFWSLNPETFSGLDWKVPIFLFTILIAMGEDGNILLMARVEEEQQTHPPVDAVRVALAKTGSIISSCGIVMAGTFAALATGTLLGMTQLGFALAFGVLLDTFVVRPILVPAFLIMLHGGRFGTPGRRLGDRRE